MFASLRARFTYSQRWIVHFGICLLASAGLVAALAPAGAAASDRQGPPPKAFFSAAENYTIRYYPRFLTYVQQGLGGFNRLAGPNNVGPLYRALVILGC
jgi:hypothetical protein